ncbi:electron transfer flavoprotein subunit beta [Marinivivus vitaminiproducens]|uniref:electron transfer flavoprotein subunit beta n=1 Tax=Marinivivus vitaminiproducens TaxID=3035935 RepID=UPI0027A38553|nr:electron transfer flavoprotein subunit beta [Geminicoccaceae bacterium SCSIO 64248]
MLSIGRHPVSGRERRASADARALELALRLGGDTVHAIHAGDPDQPALRDYLGMGLPRLSVVPMPEDHDPVPALIACLQELKPTLILAGLRGERGLDTGLLPHKVADALDFAMVPGIIDLSVTDGTATVTQVLPKAGRRSVAAPLPLLATVHPGAPVPRACAYARARRGHIERIAIPTAQDPVLSSVQRAAWRPRPKALAPTGGSARDRLARATVAKAGAGRIMIDPDPHDAARAILAELEEHGLLRK